ncbi:MAG: hypothetical protein AUH81_16555 [Candidatus Rokubacteria bacterium 13_1_40CM_4_69_5]|nr:MAG: hypothetical protein AUH81_16555 [Candidatus Rokubacteria bacterium 13_1_40CM_4_69_5]
MKTLTQCTWSLLVAAILAGCAAQQPPAPGPSAAQNTYTGEVWTWDEQASTVTLRQGARTVRVKVTPEQLVGLRLYQIVTVRGEPAPAEIERVTLPPGTFVPRGAADEAEATGTVDAIDPAGTVSITSPRGPVAVWVSGSTPFRAGEAVRVRIHVQPLELVPAKQGEAAKTPEIAASVATEPGDYAVVRGPIKAVDPAGRLTVESPRGPITVWVPDTQRYHVGDAVEVRTSVHPSR